MIINLSSFSFTRFIVLSKPGPAAIIKAGQEAKIFSILLIPKRPSVWLIFFKKFLSQSFPNFFKVFLFKFVFSFLRFFKASNSENQAELTSITD